MAVLRSAAKADKVGVHSSRSCEIGLFAGLAPACVSAAAAPQRGATSQQCGENTEPTVGNADGGWGGGQQGAEH